MSRTFRAGDEFVNASVVAGDPGVAESTERFHGGAVTRRRRARCSVCGPAGAGRFDPTHTGLDHFSFAVATRDDLAAARAAPADAGIEHGAINVLEEAGIAILSFQDPDDINTELTAPLT